MKRQSQVFNTNAVPSRTEINQQVRPATTNGRPKSPNSKKGSIPGGKENLEKEYILNLQQQIYFLELENRYLRNPEQTQKNKQKNLEEYLSDEETDDSATSDETKMHLRKLKNLSKHLQVKLERALIQKEELEKQNFHYQEYTGQLQKDKTEMQYEISHLKEVSATEKEKLVGEIMVTRKETENLQRNIKFMEGEKNNAINEREKIKSDFSSLQLDFKKARDELDYARQAEKLTSDKYEAHSKEYFEMKTKFEMWIEDKQRYEDLERSKQEAIKKVEEEKWALSSKIKQLERQLQHITQIKNATEEDNQQLLVTLEKMKKELKEEQMKHEEEKNSNVKAAAEKLALKQKAKAFDDRLNTLNDNLEIRKQAMAKMEDKISKLEHEIELLKEERIRLISEHEHYRLVDEENIKVRQENLIIQDELKDGKNELLYLDEKISKALDENLELRTNLDILKNKLKSEREREM